MSIEEIKKDQSLRPYFIRFLSKNVANGIAQKHATKLEDFSEFRPEMNSALMELYERLSEKVDPQFINQTLEEVSLYYLEPGCMIEFNK